MSTEMKTDVQYMVFSNSESCRNYGAGYWSNTEGWTVKSCATLFSKTEKGCFVLPKAASDDARWIACRTEGDKSSKARRFYQGVEVHGCVQLEHEGEKIVSRAIDEGLEPEFWSVYMIDADGFSQCVHDNIAEEGALFFADVIEQGLISKGLMLTDPAC